MKKLSILATIFMVLTIFFSGCAKGNNSAENKEKAEGKLKVYTTIFPLKDFTKKIGGEYVDVESIYPPGVDSHTFEASQKQVVDIAKSNLFIYSSKEMESFATKIEESVKNEEVKVVDSSKGIEMIKFEGDEHEHDHEGETAHDKDPHTWLDPILAIQQAENVKNALVELKPEAKKEFEQNFAALKAELEDLDTEFKDTVSNAKTKYILVSHAAYGYWQNRYGIEQIPVAGLSASQEPSQKDLAGVVKEAKEHKLKYILFETFATPKVADVVRKEAGLEILRLNHLATISDEDAKQKKDYITLMKENIEVLKKALN
ncbi:metal ABC transporter substrate-binding protein [Bacillus sp. 165]|uniref:metal ABC transporter substrate-binding protein n=1 Tax=Bacillus sp. 165 TaxID=1529117 RepID=UPI001ADB792D|nr:metal ABC transporter substrate-binding protein [Bacillus sp. 165]MBO9128160.1 zinc ABC transporter substrate-binding protein [Bacillus sp. 165]